MLLRSDARHIPLADGSVQCCVTSPPYYGLRDYGTARWDGGDPECDHIEMQSGMSDKNTLGPNGYLPQTNAANVGRIRQYRDICPKCGAIRIDNQIGLEETPDAYVAQIVAVFREVWRVLRDDGVAWLNLGDSYAGSGKFSGRTWENGNIPNMSHKQSTNSGSLLVGKTRPIDGLKPKDLIGIPFRVAFALQADGWYLRRDIVWAKGVSFMKDYAGSCMPESVRDRPTTSHEYVFLLSKSVTYFYDYDAVAEPVQESSIERLSQPGLTLQAGSDRILGKTNGPMKAVGGLDTRNLRSVWVINPHQFKGAHFATFPPALVEPMILAGSAEGDIVLDPFCGSGTTGMVARQHERRFVGLDLNARYLEDFALPRAEQKQTAASIAELPLFGA